MKIRSYATVILGLLTSSLVTAQELDEAQLRELLEHPQRFAGDKVRDQDRRPEKIMRFSQVSNGDKILDIYAGGGWYSELFARAVGEQGVVYAHNDKLTWRFGGKEMAQRSRDGRLPNVVRFDQIAITDIDLPDRSIDIVFMGINYHDLYFTHRTRNGEVQVLRDEIVDYKTAFTTVRTLLKDDGVLIITDHRARKGSGYAAANDLHRIDPNIVKFQLKNVGFKLLEEAFYLRNPNDDLDKLVFAPGIRGKTDRFIYKFGKLN